MTARCWLSHSLLASSSVCGAAVGAFAVVRPIRLHWLADFSLLRQSRLEIARGKSVLALWPCYDFAFACFGADSPPSTLSSLLGVGGFEPGRRFVFACCPVRSAWCLLAGWGDIALYFVCLIDRVFAIIEDDADSTIEDVKVSNFANTFWRLYLLMQLRHRLECFAIDLMLVLEAAAQSAAGSGELLLIERKPLVFSQSN